jgi:hypothetical protein
VKAEIALLLFCPVTARAVSLEESHACFGK